jgi:hypothetical protein
MYNMLTSFIGINATVNNISAMIYNMAVDSGINTNKTGQHVIRYTWHIVESVVKHQ